MGEENEKLQQKHKNRLDAEKKKYENDLAMEKERRLKVQDKITNIKDKNEELQTSNNELLEQNSFHKEQMVELQDRLDKVKKQVELLEAELKEDQRCINDTSKHFSPLLSTLLNLRKHVK